MLNNAKNTPSAENIALYRARLDSFLSIGNDPGVVSIYRNAAKSVWRPLRNGVAAYGYDISTGGIRYVDHDGDAATPQVPVRFPVSYPAGETVATWDVIAAVEAL